MRHILPLTILFCQTQHFPPRADEGRGSRASVPCTAWKPHTRARRTFQGGELLLGFQVQLGEHGPGHQAAGAQGGLDGAVQDLLEPRRLQLPGIRVPHLPRRRRGLLFKMAFQFRLKRQPHTRSPKAEGKAQLSREEEPVGLRHKPALGQLQEVI